VVGTHVPSFGRIRDTGTIHHCFEGGWIWVIRFDSAVVSVGLVLDRDVYPDNDRPAEEELRSFLARFPTVAAHLGGAVPVRPLVKTGRVNFSSRSTVGDRFILTPHAAGFVDALFSSGINLTQSWIARFVPLMERAVADDDFAVERFAPLDRVYQEELDTVDTIVHGMFKSFGNFDVFKQYWRTWVYGSLAQDCSRVAYDPSSCDGPTCLFGTRLPAWRAHLDQMHATLLDGLARDPGRPEETARRLKALMDSIPEPFSIANWEIGSDTACRPNVASIAEFLPWLRQLTDPTGARAWDRRRGVARFLGRLVRESVEMWSHYGVSRLTGGRFHRSIDLILEQQLPRPPGTPLTQPL
jgi:FADH2 O2-dependent halogenase